jgi:hypothetical protein
VTNLTFDPAFFAGQDIQIIFWGIAVNVALGILVSLVKGDFNLHHLSNFLHGMVLPYIFVYAVLRGVAGNLAWGSLVTQLVYVLVVLTLLAGIWEKLGHFGLPSPKWLLREKKA